MARALCRSLLSSLFLLKYTEFVGKGQHTCKAVDLEIITDLKPAAVETGAEAEGVAGGSTPRWRGSGTRDSLARSRGGGGETITVGGIKWRPKPLGWT
jgi:hypothetical protein